MCVASALSAQRRNHIAIQIAPQLGIDKNTEYNADFTLMYMRDIGRLFHLGAGAGVGVSKLNSYAFEESFSYNSKYVPVYVRAQMDFSPKAAYTYGAMKVGTRLFGSMPPINITHQGEILSLSDHDVTFMSINPSIGYNFPIGQFYLGVEAGIEFLCNWGETKFLENNGNQWHYSSFCIYKSIGIAVNLQF